MLRHNKDDTETAVPFMLSARIPYKEKKKSLLQKKKIGEGGRGAIGHQLIMN